MCAEHFNVQLTWEIHCVLKSEAWAFCCIQCQECQRSQLQLWHYWKICYIL